MKQMFRTGTIIILLILVSVSSYKSYGQLEEVGKFMAGGARDAQNLLQPYIAPAVNGFGTALAGGWYNTAEPHKLGGFDITFTANVAIIPEKYKTFVIDESSLQNLKLAPSESNEAQTIAGGNIPGPQLEYEIEYNNNTFSSPAFRMPEGLNVRYVPSPVLQAGIGLIKGTDVSVRYLPDIKMKGNEIGLWGIGGRHDIKQWIPGLKLVPVFKMSLQYGYTKLHSFVKMDITPDKIGAGSFEGAGDNTWDDQNMKIWVRSQTANLLVAADLRVVTFYGGMGFVTTKTNLKLEGDFPMVTLDGTDPVVEPLDGSLIDMEIKNQDGSVTKPRLNAGVRFKLAVITIHFDYSWANYSVVTAGLGISFR